MKVDLSKVGRIDADQKDALLKMLRHLAALDYDHATDRNYLGFNSEDTEIGHELAELTELSDNGAKAAKELLFKYWRQLPGRYFSVVYGESAIKNLERKCGRLQQRRDRDDIIYIPEEEVDEDHLLKD